jgi:hypothetical protein
MILNIYIIGLILMVVWWGVLSIMVFEERVYEKMDVSAQSNIDELRQTLEGMGSNNLQLTYFFVSMFASFLWPIVVPYLIYTKIKG